MMNSNMVDINKIKLIIFDMDGLFLDSESVYAIGWQKALDYYQIKVGDNFVSSLKGQGARDNDKAIYDLCGNMSLVKKIRQYRTDYFLDELRKGNVKLSFFALEIANYLKQRGFLIALASSSFKETVDTLLSTHNLLNFFDFKVTGSDVKSVKPSPEIYNKTLEVAGCFPSEAMAFEDSLYGIIAAEAAGIEVCHIGESNEKVKEISFASYSNLKEAYHSIFEGEK